MHVDGSHDPEGMPDLPEALNTVLFRVAQEALANIAKHAQARHAHLALRQARAPSAPGDASGVTLEVTDDGVGFDVEAVRLDPRRGIGLRNMRERVESIGGQFDVRSAPGAGTTIKAIVPAEAVRRMGQT